MNTEMQLFTDSEAPDIRESAIKHLQGIILNNNIEPLEKVQNFLVMLNQTPPETWVKKHPYIKVERTNKKTGRKEKVPYEYLGVERHELLLMKLYFGQWSTLNFRWSQVFNEIAGAIDLEVLDPVTGRTLTRTGAAAIQIMQDKDAKVSQFNETKKPNALVTGFPSLKTECFKNACKGLGPVFGSNLGRDTDDILYVPMINGKNKEELLAATLS